jgi:hypothetical protein
VPREKSNFRLLRLTGHYRRTRLMAFVAGLIIIVQAAILAVRLHFGQ